MHKINEMPKASVHVRFGAESDNLGKVAAVNVRIHAEETLENIAHALAKVGGERLICGMQ